MPLSLASIALAATILTGCTAGQTFISGYPVGDLARCDDGCIQETRFAVQWLDREAPEHPPLDRVEIHLTDYRTASGGQILMTRSGGGTFIAVFVFTDGSRAAVQVGCGVGVDPTRCFTAPPSSPET